MDWSWPFISSYLKASVLLFHLTSAMQVGVWPADLFWVWTQNKSKFESKSRHNSKFGSDFCWVRKTFWTQNRFWVLLEMLYHRTSWRETQTRHHQVNKKWTTWCPYKIGNKIKGQVHEYKRMLHVVYKKSCFPIKIPALLSSPRLLSNLNLFVSPIVSADLAHGDCTGNPVSTGQVPPSTIHSSHSAGAALCLRPLCQSHSGLVFLRNRISFPTCLDLD